MAATRQEKIEAEQQLHTIQIGSKMITLKLQDFSDPQLDVEQILQVHYWNIIGDVITYPVIFNRISVLKAEADSLESTGKLEFEIFVAQLTERKRKGFTKSHTDEKSGKEKISKPTIDEVDNAVKLDPGYRREKEKLIGIQRQAKIVDALYWSAKAKQKMLEVISAKIRPEDYEKEIIEGTVNDVIIRTMESPFVGGREQKPINPRLYRGQKPNTN